MRAPRKPIHLRVVLGRAAFGPGKVALLEGIRDSGSIAEAGRRMEMSYTRAWGLVKTMNREFQAPLVESAKGGAARGGANLTSHGEWVVARYRRMEKAAERAISADLAALRKLAR